MHTRSVSKALLSTGNTCTKSTQLSCRKSRPFGLSEQALVSWFRLFVMLAPALVACRGRQQCNRACCLQFFYCSPRSFGVWEACSSSRLTGSQWRLLLVAVQLRFRCCWRVLADRDSYFHALRLVVRS